MWTAAVLSARADPLTPVLAFGKHSGTKSTGAERSGSAPECRSGCSETGNSISCV